MSPEQERHFNALVDHLRMIITLMFFFIAMSIVASLALRSNDINKIMDLGQSNAAALRRIEAKLSPASPEAGYPVKPCRSPQMGVPLADITAISAASAKLATDQAMLSSLDDQVEAQKAIIAADTGASTQADATLSVDLMTFGPTAVVNPDGSVVGYQFSPSEPGYIITVFSPPTS